MKTPLAEVGQYFDVRETVEIPARFNIAPTQNVPVVRLGQNSGGDRELAPLRWGLIPSWASDPAVGSRNINARAETVTERPTFRSAFQRRRCLIPADGFIEWTVDGRVKQPHYIKLRSGEPFAFAGLWETWGQGEDLAQSFAIITTDANDVLRPLHERMPVILPPPAYGKWLDRDEHNTDELLELLRPYPSREMQYFAISTRVNSPRHDDPECLEPVATQKGLFD
ncbi:MAG: SOS response-associated peptidase [Pirellulales bacterium]|nr:SOS response-associated peptidase [Pirellulales bacterium]